MNLCLSTVCCRTADIYSEIVNKFILHQYRNEVFMSINKLEQIVIDMVKEQQIKLGYVKETVRLYFPADSFYAVAGNKKEEEIKKEFYSYVIDRLGEVSIDKLGERFCVVIPPKGSEFIHLYIPENKFLVDLIHIFREHDKTIEDVKQVFSKYSDNYICKEQEGEEFDYLLYFLDKQIDEYYYCVKFDGNHGSYHRFNEYDFQNLL